MKTTKVEYFMIATSDYDVVRAFDSWFDLIGRGRTKWDHIDYDSDDSKWLIYYSIKYTNRIQRWFRYIILKLTVNRLYKGRA